MIKSLLPFLLGVLSVAAYPPYPSVNTTDFSNSSIAIPDQQPFEVVIVFVEPEGGCSALCNAEEPFGSSNSIAPIHPTISSKHTTATKASSTESADEPLFTQSGSNSKLTPSLHWNTDTTPATNVIPLPVGQGSQFYHGNSDATQAGYYGFITYFFTSPSVNLDHCAHILNVIVSPSGFNITFASSESYDYALQHWSADEKLLLVTYSESCPGYKEGERCYLKVTGITYSGQIAIVVGEYCYNTNEIIHKGETEWGWWVPRYNGTVSSSGSGSGTVRPSVAWTGSSTTKTPSVISATYSSLRPTATSGNTPTDSNFAHANSTCIPPVDTKYGLPTACLGIFFDQDLDDNLGYYATLDPDVYNFINYLAPDADNTLTPVDSTPVKKRSLLTREQKLDARYSFPCLSCALKKAATFVTHPGDTLVSLKNTIQQATSISGSINKDLAFKLPDSTNAESSKLQDPSTKQVTSPWGDSVLLKSFGDQKAVGSAGLHGFMNVFCVGCGVSGHANVAGRASWTPLGGIIQGEVEMKADVQFIFKLGIDAQMTYQKEFSNTLLRLGLPGLTYGVVTIGPWVEVGSKVTLEANAQGRLLAGAEIGLTAAHVLIDFINPSNSKKDGWEPYFKPVFEAEGEIMVSAELGLPMAIKCGLQIATFSKSVGIIDEPSIKGVAQVAASVGLTTSGSFAAGFKETNGCTGISTQITWRNKLFVDILGLTSLEIFDTKDKKLAQGCIALPGLPTKPEASVTPAPTIDPTATASPATEPPTNLSTDPSTDPSTGPSVTEPEVEQPSSGAPTAESPAQTDLPTTAPTPENTPAVSSGEDTSENDPFKVRSLPSNLDRRADDTVIDRTASVNSTATSITYTPQAFPNVPYNDTEGYSYQLLTVSDGSMIFVACGNGGIYGVSPDSADNPACSEMWATYNNILVADGAQRLLHFYSDTMNATGVSRLRVANEEAVPEGSQIVVFAEMGANDTDPTNDTVDDAFYIAVDQDLNVFYPVLCTYTDGGVSKLFVVSDAVAGVTMLQSPDVKFSITGGVVGVCYTMPIYMGAWGAEYASYDDAVDPETDTLSFD